MNFSDTLYTFQNCILSGNRRKAKRMFVKILKMTKAHKSGGAIQLYKYRTAKLATKKGTC